MKSLTEVLLKIPTTDRGVVNLGKAYKMLKSYDEEKHPLFLQRLNEVEKIKERTQVPQFEKQELKMLLDSVPKRPNIQDTATILSPGRIHLGGKKRKRSSSTKKRPKKRSSSKKTKVSKKKTTKKRKSKKSSKRR